MFTVSFPAEVSLSKVNHRIIDFDDQKVSFNYKDYRHGSQKKIMTLSPQEFVRRLSLHFLPKGFCRIRHYGILSSAWKNRVFPQTTKNKDINWQDFWKNKGLDVNKCPNCKNGTLIYSVTLAPVRGPPIYPKLNTTPII